CPVALEQLHQQLPAACRLPAAHRPQPLITGNVGHDAPFVIDTLDGHSSILGTESGCARLLPARRRLASATQAPVVCKSSYSPPPPHAARCSRRYSLYEAHSRAVDRQRFFGDSQHGRPFVLVASGG